MEYTQWRNFENAISKAKEPCKNNGIKLKDHFANISKMVEIGSGAEREERKKLNKKESENL